MKVSGTIQDFHGMILARFFNATESYGAVVADCEILAMPESARVLFRELERRVESQLLKTIHEIEMQIEKLNLNVVWDDEDQKCRVWSVQFLRGGVSFRLAPFPAEP